MAVNFESLQAQVMNLPKAERLQLLERLAASLDSDVDREEYWETIAEARDAEMDARRGEGVPLEEAIERLRAKFPG